MTALELITDALGLTSAVGVDQALTADEAALGLRVANETLEDWSTQSLAVYGLANQTFNTISNQAVYTIGTGGDWNTTRPIAINDPAYSVYQNVSFPCYSMTQGEYNLIPFKDQTQQFPARYLFVNEYPLARITLWPVPSQVTPITFSINRVLTEIPNLSTVLSFPPGYLKAFKYAVGTQLAPYFGKSISQYPDVQQIAVASFAHIKRANRKKRVMMVDPAFSDYNYDNWAWQVWP